ncbi:MAG: methylated-DNA--[protein]-cysteine S-methyltransferase [Gammaproteobacteria bacterium]|nr:methylated-DNA--[protein]-cysteine S-methyltransferase [Gammaproteobacteria bacterium]
MTKNSFDYILPSPIGSLGLNISVNGIQRLFYIKTKQESYIPTGGFAAKVHQQIMEYFELQRTEFDLPVDIQGTAYQNRVWNEVAKIPYGESLTYGDIAKVINSGPRAVGNACRHNPVPIIIPCHRVVRKGGIGGYCGSVMGKQVQQKDWLLRHEIGTPVTSEIFV